MLVFRRARPSGLAWRDAPSPILLVEARPVRSGFDQGCPQVPPWIDTELIVEYPLCLVVGLKRLGMAAYLFERGDELCAHPFVEWFIADVTPCMHDDLLMTIQRRPGVQQRFASRGAQQAQLLGCCCNQGEQ